MSEMTYLEAVNQTLHEELSRDKKVIFMGEDIGSTGGAFGCAKGLFDKYGSQRIIETPISENSFIGVATGASLAGLRPIVEIMYMDFLLLGADQVCNHLSKLRYIYGGQSILPVTIRTTTGGNCRYGASHAQNLEALFKHVPGLKIATPSNANDAKWLLQHAVRDDNPWLVIESRKLYNNSCEITSETDVPVGKARVMLTGKDLTLVTYSRMVPECELAVSRLRKEKGIDIELIDLRTINPLDHDTIHESVQKTGRLVVVHEAYKTCGVGAEIVSQATEACLKYMIIPPLRIGAKDTPIPASSVLEDHNVPSSVSIEKSILDHLEKFL